MKLNAGVLGFSPAHSFSASLLFLYLYVSSVSAYKTEFVTCGSVVKLFNVDLKLRLHSHNVQYGTGSGQQSVTATEIQEDINSNWQIKPETGKSCRRGEPIKCGTVIRFYHLETKKNLHSHHFMSPLSKNQEISCYGDEKGEGDSGDHWILVCNNDFWRRDTPVKFKHVDTDVYLAGSGRTFGRPINGQGEVVGVTSTYSSYTDWQVKEGLFIHPNDLGENRAAHVHSEL